MSRELSAPSNFSSVGNDGLATHHPGCVSVWDPKGQCNCDAYSRLEGLIALVVRHWPFDGENYPRMRGLSSEEQREFALCHILLHQVKAVAKLTEALEPIDHGAPLHDGTLRQATRNFLINTLRLAEVAGIEPNELVAYIHGWAQETHVP